MRHSVSPCTASSFLPPPYYLLKIACSLLRGRQIIPVPVNDTGSSRRMMLGAQNTSTTSVSSGRLPRGVVAAQEPARHGSRKLLEIYAPQGDSTCNDNLVNNGISCRPDEGYVMPLTFVGLKTEFPGYATPTENWFWQK